MWSRKLFSLLIISVIILTIIYWTSFLVDSSNRCELALQNTQRSSIVQLQNSRKNANEKTSTNKSILENVKYYNELQMIRNEEKFGPLQNDSVIIIVQVHKRINYLKYSIESLAQAKHISETLLIFSHDYYDEDINTLVQSIDFCKVLQVNQHE